jgi:hypothetical protein
MRRVASNIATGYSFVTVGNTRADVLARVRCGNRLWGGTSVELCEPQDGGIPSEAVYLLGTRRAHCQDQ